MTYTESDYVRRAATEALFLRTCARWRISRSLSVTTGGGHLGWSPHWSPSIAHW